jgi:hypothetical protein
MEVISFFHPAKPMNLVDIFINEPISFDEIEREIVIFEARDIKIPVISKNHLIFLKSKAHRPQDIADIEALEALEQMGNKNEKHP